MKVQFQPNEVAIQVSDTRYLDNGSSVNGKFIVTNQRCYFANENNTGALEQMSIEPDRIREVVFFKTGILRSDGLQIVFSDGSDLRFSMKKRNDIGKLINQMY